MIEAAPSRRALPTQSAPVSPPPITITCLPAAVIVRGAGAGAVGGGAELAGDPAVADVEVLHREVDAVELAAGDRQVAGDARADGQDDGVELGAELARCVMSRADVDAAAELDALGDAAAGPGARRSPSRS